MENEEICEICFNLGCTRCSSRWNVILKNRNPSLKSFQSFLDTHCPNCGSDNRCIAMLDVSSLEPLKQTAVLSGAGFKKL